MTIQLPDLTVGGFFLLQLFKTIEFRGIKKQTVMKKLVFTLAIILSFTVTAQDQYTKGMAKAMALWQQGKTTEAANLFERIAMAEEDNWLPYYYVTQLNTIAAFGTKEEEEVSQLLAKAKDYLAMAQRISTNNAELLVQEAMINTAWIAFDGATYGPTLAGKNAQLYTQAAQIAPENPRVVYAKASWDMGSARYFGKDTTPYCKDLEKALELFATFEEPTPFYPNWGVEQATKELEQCKP